jgi:uncharacterized membrane protein
MSHSPEEAARRWFGKAPGDLAEAEQHVVRKLMLRKPISRAPGDPASASFGDRLADRVASFGGSWTFIILFGLVLLGWTAGNSLLSGRAFDPYPFIFLNLILSMLAAIQAPIIMMSQNRQGAKDRTEAEHDYEVNLKAEIEIMALHEKLDELRARDIEGLIARQQEQIELLQRMIQEKR